MPQKIAEFKNLYVSYGEGDALKGVSLEIDRLAFRDLGGKVFVPMH